MKAVWRHRHTYSGTRQCSCSMWCSNSLRKCLMNARTGIAAASPSAQIVRPWMLSATEFSRSMSSGRPCAVLDPVDDAVQPAGALAARRALAAALLEIEVRQALEATHHAARLVHHDDRARARASTPPWRSSRSPCRWPSSRRPAAPASTSRRGCTALILRPSRMPPASSSSFANGVPSGTS